MKPANSKDRFERHVMADPNSGCWLWTGALTHNGYGHMQPVSGEWRAHRVSWVLHRGPIPSNLQVLHKCDVRSCVNPDHLFLGTNQENRTDMWKKDRGAKGESAGTSRLTNQEVRQLRDLFSSGQQTQAELCRKFNVVGATVCNIIHRKTWKHI